MRKALDGVTVAGSGSRDFAVQNACGGSLATLLFAAIWLPGFGGGGQLSSAARSSQPGTPAGTYILTITASSPDVIHTTSLTLTVQD